MSVCVVLIPTFRITLSYLSIKDKHGLICPLKSRPLDPTDKPTQDSVVGPREKYIFVFDATSAVEVVDAKKRINTNQIKITRGF